MSDEHKVVAYDRVTGGYFLIDIDEIKKSFDQLNRILLNDAGRYLDVDDLLNSLPNLNS